MTKLASIIVQLLLASTQAIAFHLSAEVYHDDETVAVGKPLYVTRYGFLTFDIGDADEFDINDKQQLVTFPGKPRSRPIGVFNTTLVKQGYAPLTSLEVRQEAKITTNFTTYKGETDDDKEKYEVLGFENDVFQDGEAVFMAQKPYKGSNETNELEGQQIFVLAEFGKLDSEYWRLVDLLVVREKEGRDEI